MLKMLAEMLSYRGSTEPEVLAGCTHAVKLIYWTLVLIALPPVIWEHLVHNPTPLVWLYLSLVILYLPIAMGWFPKDALCRLRINAVILTVLGLSINSIYDWKPQAGIYLMLPAGLMAFAMRGGPGLLKIMALQMLAVAATTLWLNPMRPWAGVAIALTTWLAVAGAASTVMWHMLIAAQERSREREEMAQRLRENDALLRDNERSVHHIVAVGLGEAEAAVEELTVDDPNQADNPAISRLKKSLKDVREALG
jgi:hypothetical protein